MWRVILIVFFKNILIIVIFRTPLERAQRLFDAKNNRNGNSKNVKSTENGIDKEGKRKYNLAKLECHVLRLVGEKYLDGQKT
jgi:hypothetical protein